MHINPISNNSTNFTALKVNIASKRFLNSLEKNALENLRQTGKEMTGYKYWDLELTGYGPVVVDRKNKYRIDDFRPGATGKGYRSHFKSNPDQIKIIAEIEAKKTPLEQATELTKQLEKQSAANHIAANKDVDVSSKEYLIDTIIVDFYEW